MNYKYLVMGAIVLGVSSLIWHPQSNSNKTTIKIGNHELVVEAVSTLDKLTLGLSGRTSLADNEGMLFIFPKPLLPGFWMKDMKFALDIVWISADKKVVAINDHLQPNSYPETFMPPSEVVYVLEVNAGWADKNVIKSGDSLVLNP